MSDGGRRAPVRFAIDRRRFGGWVRRFGGRKGRWREGREAGDGEGQWDVWEWSGGWKGSGVCEVHSLSGWWRFSLMGGLWGSIGLCVLWDSNCVKSEKEEPSGVPECWLVDAAASSGAPLDVREAQSKANRSEEDRRGTTTSPTNSDAAIPTHCDPETTTPPSCEAYREFH